MNEFRMPSAKYDETMLATAALWAVHGTCSRMQVGVVFAKESRILVQGYNGSPSGLPHCNHECDCKALIAGDVGAMPRRQRADEESTRARTGHYLMCNSQKPCDWAVHAEQNGIAWAARTGISLDGSTAYSTHQPCVVCARLIITAGVARVVYDKPYRLADGLHLLRRAGVSVKQCGPIT